MSPPLPFPIQTESFLRTVETWSQALGFQPAEVGAWALEEEGDRLRGPASRPLATLHFVGQASPEASLHPEAETPQPSGLQGPPFEDILAVRSSDWLRQPSRAGAGSPMPDTQSPWDPEPRFWQDVLTEQLWQIFTGTHKTDQHRRSESPWGWGMGVAWGQPGDSTTESCCPTLPPAPPRPSDRAVARPGE